MDTAPKSKLDRKTEILTMGIAVVIIIAAAAFGVVVGLSGLI
jgi:hypothetical protein